MHYHIILTETCNSECNYCYKKSMEEFDNGLDKKFKFDFSAPEKSEVSVKKLKKFLEKDRDAVLIFYGGEPLMEIDKIKEIMDEIKVPFRMQTNGKLLHELPSEYINRIDKILVSIDGNKERTDFNKGKGTFDKVIANIKFIRRNGYKGEIIARMTIDQKFPDLYEQVLNLINLNSFDSYHWQLDAGFFKFDFNEKTFSKFVEEYNKSVSKLIDYWINELKKGKVLRIYPFIAIVDSLLKNEPTKLRCGAGHYGYAIATDGKIIACPIMNCIKDFEAGTLDSEPEKLRKFDVEGRCLACDYKDLCGGRCLYWNKAGLWPENGDEIICKTIKHLIDELINKLPEIKELIKNKRISEKDFEYEKYFGPEIIP
ncbi:MAG: TIGR04084 family radical SAM/SPASM domain-containing protein [Candidatus Nanoarchaeia archaeon]|nr:TIGR04084 family radical SAM/SPASM domain-containing protein [Candidatus Nanoarchaeia archaeon]